MARKKKRGPKPGSVDWDEVDKLISFQCTQREIAEFFGISVDSLERYCQRDRKMKLAELFEQKKGAGRVKLRKIQFQLAEQGSTGMAIWLGKQILGQTDEAVDVEILKAIQAAGLTKDQALEAIAQASATAHKSGKKTFKEFCAAAGYPEPFEKQIEMMNFGMFETAPRLLLGSRGYGKTDYVVILGIAYMIYLDPINESNLIISKSKERNSAMLDEIAKALTANGVSLSKQNSNHIRTAVRTGKDHSVSAVTIKTVSLRGRHPKRVVMDDPVTEDDTSEATRNLVEKKYNEVHKLCSNILIIGQPAHKYDLYAKLRDLVKKMEVPHGTIPELDHDLEAQRLAGVSEESISASYHLKVISDGSIAFNKIRYIDKYPNSQSVAWIDPSEGGDFTAMTVMTAYMEGVAVVGYVWKKAWHHCLDEIADVVKKRNVRRLAFETNSFGQNPVDILREVLPADCGVVGQRSDSNKHGKIMAAGAYSHMIHLSRESHKLYIDQVIKYEYKAKFDDAPDSMASCLKWIGLIRGGK